MIQSQLNLHGKKIVDINDIMNTINMVPMNYVGNKKKLIKDFIHPVMNDMDYDIFIDLFAGSSSVSLYNKLRNDKIVITNDLLVSSYISSVVLIENNGVDISSEEIDYILNTQPDSKDTKYRVLMNFMAKYDNLFTKNEQVKLATYKYNIDTLFDTRNEKLFIFYYNITNIIKNACRIMNGSIKYTPPIDIRKRFVDRCVKYNMCYSKTYLNSNNEINFEKLIQSYCNKFNTFYKKCYALGLMTIAIKRSTPYSRGLKWIDRKNTKYAAASYLNSDYEIDFDRVIKQSIYPVFSNNNTNHISFNMDAIDFLSLLSNLNVDMSNTLIYIDPPYGGDNSDYLDLYSFIESYITGVPFIKDLPYYEKMQRFTSYDRYIYNFNIMLKLLHKLKPKHIIFSFNNSSFIGIKSIKKMLSHYWNVEIHDTCYNYNFRKNDNRSGIEYLMVTHQH